MTVEELELEILELAKNETTFRVNVEAHAKRLGLKIVDLRKLVETKIRSLSAARRAAQREVKEGEQDTARTGYKSLEYGSEAEIAKRACVEAEHVAEFRFDEGVYAWNENVHEVVAPTDIEQMFILPFDGAFSTEGRTKLTKSKLKGIRQLMQDHWRCPGWFNDRPVGVNLIGGFVQYDPVAKNLVERPHHPDLRQRTIIKARYIPDFVLSEDSKLAYFMRTPFNDDPELKEKRRYNGQIAGASLFGVGSNQEYILEPKAHVYKGTDPNSGKTSFTRLYEGMVGEGNYANVPLHEWKNPNSLRKLIGKLLNTAGEIAVARAIDSDIFKRAVVGEKLTTKTLYEDESDFYPPTCHIFATNRLPSFTESDLGVKRRLGVLLFPQSIPKAIRQQTKTIVRDILRDEYELLVNFAIQGALDLLREGEYTLPQSSTDTVENWMTQSDICKMWAARMTEDTDDRGIMYHEQRAFDMFNVWALRQGYSNHKSMIPTIRTWRERLAELKPATRSDDEMVRGIFIRDEEPSNFDATMDHMTRQQRELVTNNLKARLDKVA